MMDEPREICLHVCITCRPAGGPDERDLRPGALLYRALCEAFRRGDAPPVRLQAVECLSVCKRPCTVAVTGPGRWTYIYGDLDPELSIETILDGVRRYAATSDGLIPWRERPEAFRKGVVARVPPFQANLIPADNATTTDPSMSDLMKIPCTVVTGFLGAGKTTLVRHLLENAGGRRLAVLVNEFGDLGFDGSFIEGCGISGCTKEDIVELPNGCICCTVADDFIPALNKLLNRPNAPEHILIETSGLALPKPLVNAFNWPAIRSRVTVDGVVAVVDGPAVAAGLFAEDPQALASQRAADKAVEHDNPLEEVFEDQLLCADLILLNKVDQMEMADLLRVQDEIRAHLPRSVKVVETAHGQLDPAVVIGLEVTAESDLASRPSHHETAEDHDHDDFESIAVPVEAVASPEALAARVERAAEARGVLRIKGFAPVDGKPLRLVVQGVGRRVAYNFDRPWKEGEVKDGRLVVIGLKGFDREAVAAALNGA